MYYTLDIGIKFNFRFMTLINCLELGEFREALEFLRIDTAIDIRRLDGPGEGSPAIPDPPLRHT